MADKEVKDETTDPFELSSEDFEAEKRRLMGMDFDAPVEEPTQDTPAAEDAGPGETTAEEPAETTPLFGQQETTPGQGETAQEEQQVTLIYKGEEKVVPISEAVKLAQMGFDYTQKMNKIAPHRKMVELLEADEELQKKVNDHIEDKTKPKLAPLDEFDNEDEWLKENLKRSETAARAKKEQDLPAGVQTVVDAVKARDPEHYQLVLSKMNDYTGKLTVEEYNKVNNDSDEFIKFYDRVRADVLSKNTGGVNSPSKPAASSPFRMKSSGGPAPMKQKPKNAWELPGKEFNAILQKVKGY